MSAVRSTRRACARSSTAIDRYAVLVLHDQDLDDERQLAFARNFGEIESAAQRPRRGQTPAAPGDLRHLQPRREQPAARRGRSAPLRSARQPAVAHRRLVPPDPGGIVDALRANVPRSGGETEFADLRAAWDALPDQTKAEIDGLVAMHDIAYSRAQIGFTELLFGETRETAGGAAASGARASRLRAQDALPRRARLAHCRPADPGGPAPAARPDRARDRARFRLSARMAPTRPGDLGQSLHNASRPAFRRDPAARLHRATTRDVASTLDQVA